MREAEVSKRGMTEEVHFRGQGNHIVPGYSRLGCLCKQTTSDGKCSYRRSDAIWLDDLSGYRRSKYRKVQRYESVLGLGPGSDLVSSDGVNRSVIPGSMMFPRKHLEKEIGVQPS